MTRSQPPPVESELEAALARTDEVLFLCSGNILRSAFAEAFARHLLLPRPVRSGATTYHNDRGPHPEAVAALRERGVSPATWADFRPTPLGELRGTLGPGTLVLGMTREHLEPLEGEAGAGSFLLTALLGRVSEISDPYFDGRFTACFAEIENCVTALQGRFAALGRPPRSSSAKGRDPVELRD